MKILYISTFGGLIPMIFVGVHRKKKNFIYKKTMQQD
jgi:hypothetical protein